jgi:hypothetical protein
MLAISRIEPSGSITTPPQVIPPTIPVPLPHAGVPALSGPTLARGPLMIVAGLAALAAVGGFIYWNETRR